MRRPGSAPTHAAPGPEVELEQAVVPGWVDRARVAAGLALRDLSPSARHRRRAGARNGAARVRVPGPVPGGRRRAAVPLLGFPDGSAAWGRAAQLELLAHQAGVGVGG